MLMLPMLVLSVLVVLAVLVFALPLWLPLVLGAFLFINGRHLRFGHRRRQQLFRDTLFTLLGAVSCADNRVSRTEIRYCDSVIRELGLDAEGRTRAIECFKRGMAPDFHLEICMAPFLREYRHDLSIRMMLWTSLIRMAFADNVVSPGEQHILRRIAMRMDMGMVFAHSFAGAGMGGRTGGNRSASGMGEDGGALAAAHATLGVRPADDAATIKRAWRKLMSRYHPDKLAHKGLPPEALQAATDKAQDIQKAYDLIRHSRGL